MSLYNPTKWNWDQWKASGRHILTAITSVIATAVFFGLITSDQAATIGENITVIAESTAKIFIAIGGIAAAVTPIYSAIRASRAASPEKQAEATVRNIAAADVAEKEKEKVIEAVAELPEIKQIVTKSPDLADAIPSEKVVSK